VSFAHPPVPGGPPAGRSKRRKAMVRKILSIAVFGIATVCNSADVLDSKKDSESKYKYGMAMADVQKLFKNTYEVLGSEADFSEEPGGVPSEKTKLETSFYLIDIKEEGLSFFFNYYKQLIKIRLSSAPNPEGFKSK